MDLLRRALAGAYDIEFPLGRGGAGLVYRARERRLDRLVALKVLDPELAADDECRERFLAEARTAARLTHPNLVPIFSVGERRGFVFYAMAYVAGETLFQRVLKTGPLPAEMVARLLRDVAEALDYAHARGVVHRDVKPDNILLEAVTGRALLSDFGIAHVARLGVGLGRPAAPAGRVIGTAGFMSPEQALGDAVDARSDIYSLGIVAYYALSGQLPFAAATDDEVLALHIEATPAPLASVARLVPPRLADVVERCLAREPWARFASAAALVHAVDAASGGAPVSLAVRAFLMRSAHLTIPARIHALLIGAGLLPLALASWLEPGGAHATSRGPLTLALAAALAVPLAVAVARARGLLKAGQRRADLLAAMRARLARRREEVEFAYGRGSSSLERMLAWGARVGLVVTAFAATWPGDRSPDAAAIAGAITLAAAVLARARTEQRIDVQGEARLRFWAGPAGRVLFRIAAVGLAPATPIVTLLSRNETPA